MHCCASYAPLNLCHTSLLLFPCLSCLPPRFETAWKTTRGMHVCTHAFFLLGMLGELRSPCLQLCHLLRCPKQHTNSRWADFGGRGPGQGDTGWGGTGPNLRKACAQQTCISNPKFPNAWRVSPRAVWFGQLGRTEAESYDQGVLGGLRA